MVISNFPLSGKAEYLVDGGEFQPLKDAATDRKLVKQCALPRGDSRAMLDHPAARPMIAVWASAAVFFGCCLSALAVDMPSVLAWAWAELVIFQVTSPPTCAADPDLGGPQRTAVKETTVIRFWDDDLGRLQPTPKLESEYEIQCYYVTVKWRAAPGPGVCRRLPGRRKPFSACELTAAERESFVRRRAEPPKYTVLPPTVALGRAAQRHRRTVGRSIPGGVRDGDRKVSVTPRESPVPPRVWLNCASCSTAAHGLIRVRKANRYGVVLSLECPAPAGRLSAKRRDLHPVRDRHQHLASRRLAVKTSHVGKTEG